MRMRLALLIAALWGAITLAHAQGAAPPPWALDLREEVQQIPVTVTSGYGLQVSGPLTLTSYRPAGVGPFPLVVMSHGRGIAERRAQPGRQRYEPLVRYLVSKGFAVFVPTRLGYGDTYGRFDPENAGSCNALRVEAASLAASEQVLATVAHARSLPWVDASRWVAIGQSVGGLATVAVAWRHPEGLVAAINFAGGSGGNPELRPGDPCSPQVTESLWRSKARDARVTMLWVYWSNDRYWGADWPQRWARAWQDGGGALEFHQLPAVGAVGADGHAGLSRDMNGWVPLVEAYLAKAGFVQPGVVVRPPANAYAALDDLDKLPANQGGREVYQSRFLAAKTPRAFAIGPGGVAGWATGDWAMGRALGFCQSTRGVTCKLYAVDEDVVWVP